MNRNFESGISIDIAAEQNTYEEVCLEAIEEFRQDAGLAVQAMVARIRYAGDRHAEYIKRRIEELGL